MSPIAGVFYRDYRQRMTNISFVLWDLFVPLAYLALFGLGFQYMMNAPVAGVSYTAFFLPGVLAMVAFTIAMNTAWGFFMDKDAGIFYELLTYPITRPQFLIGKICFSLLLSVIGSLLAILLGVFALDVRIRWDLLPLAAVVLVFTTATWFFLFSTLAIRLARMDAFNTIVSAAYILLMFMSPMFYPIVDLPAWFRVLAWLNPMTWQVDLLRFGLLGGEFGLPLVLEACALVAFSLFCLWLASRALNRVD